MTKINTNRWMFINTVADVDTVIFFDSKEELKSHLKESRKNFITDHSQEDDDIGAYYDNNVIVVPPCSYFSVKELKS